jgi:hypothetical protein
MSAKKGNVGRVQSSDLDDTQVSISHTPFYVCRIFQQKIKEIEKEVIMIENGTHPELSSRMEDIEKKKARRISITTSWRKVYVESGKRLYEGNLHQAKCHFLVW